MEDDLHSMSMIVVLIDEHQRPLTVGSQHCIHRHQRTTLLIANVTGCMKQLVLLILWFSPLLRQHLCRKELRRTLLDAPIMVGSEHVIRSPAVPARWVRG